MSKIYCSTCKYYDYNTREGVDWCKLNDEETGICGYCEREFEDLEEAIEHYDAIVEENNKLYSLNCEMASKIADLETKLAESEKDIQKYRQHLEISNKKVIDMDKSWTKDVMELEEQIDQLKQQLAESKAKVASREDEIKFKEADINQLKWILEGKKKDIDQLKQQLADMAEKYNACQEARKLEAEFSQQDKKELTKKLAEKDAEVQSWKDGTMVVKLGKLEEQLAEKDKTIECLQEINQSLGKSCNNNAKEIDKLTEQLILAKMGESFEQEKKNNALKYQNQTAIAELEKVKEYWLKHEDIGYYVDQQIKELKGEK